MEHKQFKNPPIKEAIFAISFKENIPHELLLKFSETKYAKDNFPTLQPGFVVTVSNKQKSESDSIAPISTTHEIEGFILKCVGERNRLIQVKPSMLSYHNFNQYAGWENMYNELREIWKVFCGSSGKPVVSQISVRYLNHLSLPFPFKNGFKDYIKLMPQIPKGINNNINNFFIQIDVNNDAGDLKGIITETVLHSNDKDLAKFLIDISVVKQDNFDCEEEEMWNTFKKIRDFKNNLFLSCITKETEKLFN